MELGKGSFGTAYKIRDKRDNKMLIFYYINILIKIIAFIILLFYKSKVAKQLTIKCSKSMKYINSECNLLKENHHENILKYLDVLIEGKIYYLLTEYYQVLI